MFSFLPYLVRNSLRYYTDLRLFAAIDLQLDRDPSNLKSPTARVEVSLSTHDPLELLLPLSSLLILSELIRCFNWIILMPMSAQEG